MDVASIYPVYNNVLLWCRICQYKSKIFLKNNLFQVISISAALSSSVVILIIRMKNCQDSWFYYFTKLLLWVRFTSWNREKYIRFGLSHIWRLWYRIKSDYWTTIMIVKCYVNRQWSFIIDANNTNLVSFKIESASQTKTNFKFKVRQNRCFLVSSLSRLSSNFDQFILNNVEGMKSRDKSVWWTERRNANRTLEEFLKDLEKQVIINGVVKTWNHDLFFRFKFKNKATENFLSQDKDLQNFLSLKNVGIRYHELTKILIQPKIRLAWPNY